MNWIKKPPSRFRKSGLHKLWGLMSAVGITVALMSGVPGCEDDDLLFSIEFEDVQGVVLDSITFSQSVV